MKTHFLATLAVVAGCAMLAPGATGCGATVSSHGSTSSGSASSSIGAAGGSASTVEGASVDIPAGALTAQTAITIQRDPGAQTPAHATVVGDPYVLGPEGTTFTVPVTVTLPFVAASLPQGKHASDVVLYTAPVGSTEFTALPTTLADATHAKATTLHFSVFVAVVADDTADAGAACATDGDCARGEVCANGACVVPPDVDAGEPDAEADADSGGAPDAADDAAPDADVDSGVACTTDADCAREEVCTAGACVCAPSTTSCAGVCTDVTSDPGNCGACGAVCPAGTICAGSVCTIEILDGGTDAAVDASEAGDGDVACRTDLDCAAGQSCVNGVCMPATP